jgi:hypothetical protein
MELMELSIGKDRKNLKFMTIVQKHTAGGFSYINFLYLLAIPKNKTE